MKMYNWINSYTAGGQNAAIQIAHAQVGVIEMFGDKQEVKDWIKDKTTVVLKGGNHRSLMDMKELFEMGYLPWYAFRESIDAANGVMTCVACLPTERLVKAAAALRMIGKKNFIYHDNSLVMQVRDDGEYMGFVKRYLDMMYGSCLDFSSNIERVRHCVKTETFTPWETAVIELIAGSRTA